MNASRCIEWKLLLRRVLSAALCCAALGAQAHKSSDAYLRLEAADDGGTSLRWDIALRDLDSVLDMDADGDARLTWGEVRASWQRIDALALSALEVPGCRWAVRAHALERRSDGAYAALSLHSDCASAQVQRIGYRLFRNDDPTHRGLLRAGGESGAVLVLDPNGDALALPAWAASPATQRGSLFAEGVRHIIGGYDHVLFLLCLLLPSVMNRDGRAWRPVVQLGDAVWPVLGIVTAFTVAHSISLALAVTHAWLPPSSVIEPAIAATIVLAALDNLRPVLGRHRAAVTFIFGLVHGFGFAGALDALDLSAGAMAWALLRFNLGIEAGQLAIVGAALGLLFALRHWRSYPGWVLQGGSVAAMVAGAGWFVERV